MTKPNKITWWVVFFDPTGGKMKASILKLNTINFQKIGELLAAKKEVGITASIIAFDPRINKPAFIESAQQAKDLGLYYSDDTVVMIGPQREKMQWLGQSMITFGDNECFGYLMDFGEKGVFSAEYGKVDVTPKEARINNLAYEEAELNGLDNRCEIGQWGRFYLKRLESESDSTLVVTTFLGTIVSSLVEKKARGKIVFTRKGKTFEGKKDEESDIINFKRIK